MNKRQEGKETLKKENKKAIINKKALQGNKRRKKPYKK